MLVSERVSQGDLASLFRSHLTRNHVPTTASPLPLPPADPPIRHDDAALFGSDEHYYGGGSSSYVVDKIEDGAAFSRSTPSRLSSVPVEPTTSLEIEEFWTNEPYQVNRGKWLKYGQKQMKAVTKEYFKCAQIKCKARKFIEKHQNAVTAKFHTIFEGNHDHDIPEEQKVVEVVQTSDELKRIIVARFDSNQEEKAQEGDEKKKKKDCLRKMEIKCAVGVATSEDGFRWKKYGSKEYKGCLEPRGYYRCVTKTCPARKTYEAQQDCILLVYTSDHTHPPPPPKSELSLKTDPTSPPFFPPPDPSFFLAGPGGASLFPSIQNYTKGLTAHFRPADPAEEISGPDEAAEEKEAPRPDREGGEPPAKRRRLDVDS